MKFVLVTFRQAARGNKNNDQFAYPKGFSGVEIVAVGGKGPIYHLPIELDDEGKAVCLCYVPDDLSARYLKQHPDEIREATDAEADTFVATQQKDMPDYVVDTNTMQALIARQGAGIAMTPEELEMLDPAKPRIGIVRRVTTKEAIFGIKPPNGGS